MIIDLPRNNLGPDASPQEKIFALEQQIKVFRDQVEMFFSSEAPEGGQPANENLLSQLQSLRNQCAEILKIVNGMGTLGSKWYLGDLINGTEIAAQFPNSGISYARVNDQYLNANTGNVYSCILQGPPALAQWKYEGCISGPTGGTGPQGAPGKTPQMEIDSNGHLIAIYD